jgi:hypothetical protein
MTMPVGLSSQELTTEERIENALVVIACALTGKRPNAVFPWLKGSHG